MIFKLIKQYIFGIDYHWINNSVFSIIDNEFSSFDEVLTNFIKSPSFKEDSRPKLVKESLDKSIFLRSAFDNELLRLSDFRMYSKDDVDKLVIQYTTFNVNEEKDLIYRKLRDKLDKFLITDTQSAYYVINKDWFDSNDDILNEPENWAYAYYMIIIYLTFDKVFMCEWGYD